jgi:hypothetical protein
VHTAPTWRCVCVTILNAVLHFKISNMKGKHDRRILDIYVRVLGALVKNRKCAPTFNYDFVCYTAVERAVTLPGTVPTRSRVEGEEGTVKGAEGTVEGEEGEAETRSATTVTSRDTSRETAQRRPRYHAP